MNLIKLTNHYNHQPDTIAVQLNGVEVYHGPGNVGSVAFDPVPGTNTMTVHLLDKSPDNFIYNGETNTIDFDSYINVDEIVVQSRYFRSLLTKLGCVEVDQITNPNFPNSNIPSSTMITMPNCFYTIQFEFPVKNWMQKNLHNRDLEHLPQIYNIIKRKFQS